MPAATLVRPDTDLIRGVLASGGGDLKKCFQCATCSTVCELSPEDAPFPRKQMMEAQWGLKDRLLKEIDAKADSLRFYFLDATAVERVEHHGVREPRDLTEPLVI